MAKEKSAKKDSKKDATKSLKEKRAEKKEKKVVSIAPNRATYIRINTKVCALSYKPFFAFRVKLIWLLVNTTYGWTRTVENCLSSSG